MNITNEDNMALMSRYEDNYFDLAIVDPPYGINASKMTMGSGKHNFKKNKDWDSNIPSKEYFDELFRVSKNQIIWGGNYFTEYLHPTPHWLIWDKKNPNLSFAEGEMAWVRNGKNLRIFKKYSALADTVGGKMHPTQKHVALYEWQLQNYADKDFKILDTHLGSGSIACAIDNMNKIEKMNLEFTACELDKEYFDKAMERIRKHTNQLTIF